MRVCEKGVGGVVVVVVDVVSAAALAAVLSSSTNEVEIEGGSRDVFANNCMQGIMPS